MFRDQFLILYFHSLSSQCENTLYAYIFQSFSFTGKLAINFFRVGLQNFSLIKKFKVFINYCLGPILFVWLSISIYRHIVIHDNWQQSWAGIKASVTGSEGWKFFIVVLLMFVNWGIESLKWKVLIKHIQPISYLRAFKAVLSGLSVSVAMNTPNGVGEYFGRILYVREGNRLRAIALTFVGNISQLIITVSFGWMGLIFLRYNLENLPQLDVGLPIKWIRVLLLGSLAGVFILLFVYFKISWFIRLLERIPFVSKYAFFIQKLEEFEWRELLKVLLMSMLRYSVFIAQYVLLLQVFDVQITLLQSCWLTMVMFLALAIVPTIALAELGLRGQLSIHLFGLFSNNTLGIVLTATGIWLINLIVPALAGSLFILGIKLFRSKT
jgi:hypothetical protein